MLRGSIIEAVARVPVLRDALLASRDYTTDVAGPANGWANRRAATRQDRMWTRVIRDAEAGSPRADLSALSGALHSNAIPGAPRIVEVGCGSGYVSRFVHRVRPDSTYVGVDASQAMLDLARTRNPSVEFVEGNALALPFADDSFDVVIDGAALIHIGDERRAMAEYARVARAVVVLQSVTCCESSANTAFTKRAYGEPVREYVYSRQLLVKAVEAVGMRVDVVLPGLDYDLQKHIGVKTVSETWVLTHVA